jgi:hypothetical protein
MICVCEVSSMGVKIFAQKESLKKSRSKRVAQNLPTATAYDDEGGAGGQT